ncbi:prepilin-type N-terminal cleavage/methylation domain-containing protein [Rhizocola hellebori]|uniref:Prepilin-type N-terminal cleavage/methylation domain-containing protein n=1 Tax=Rhizocola hellebori TaxID=1392758 RepID=A0A8J3VH06_9ACTN|nr:prepilin-type N-terminal cleavage/methylation domain-containing protein [Rhizocola hellebori]GIH05531.1 prepilin-type N-terminal cleavage/methylation domain-containing protein [Rhizocola hellebori]
MQLRNPLTGRDDRGVTLIELLMAVVLLTIIMVPLANALIVFFKNTDATNDRLAASHDAQIAAAYFAQDVQSIGAHDWSDAPYVFRQSVAENSKTLLGNSCFLTGAADPRILLAVDNPTTATSTPPVVVVAYVVKGQELHRLRCDASDKQDIVVAHNLAASPVTVTCRDLARAVQQCAGAGLPVPQSIEMRLEIQVSGSDDTLTVNLTGQRRQT